MPDAERRRFRACFLRQYPYMLSMLERDRPGRAVSAAAPSSVTVSLGEAFRNERWLAILGDPGSGKTTLGRWLAVKLARGLLDGGDGSPIRVPAFQVNPETSYDRRLIDLGPARLPILVRVAKFAPGSRRRKRGERAIFCWSIRFRGCPGTSVRPPLASESPRTGSEDSFGITSRPAGPWLFWMASTRLPRRPTGQMSSGRSSNFSATGSHH